MCKCVSYVSLCPRHAILECDTWFENSHGQHKPDKFCRLRKPLIIDYIFDSFKALKAVTLGPTIKSDLTRVRNPVI